MWWKNAFNNNLLCFNIMHLDRSQQYMLEYLIHCFRCARGYKSSVSDEKKWDIWFAYYSLTVTSDLTLSSAFKNASSNDCWFITRLIPRIECRSCKQDKLNRSLFSGIDIRSCWETNVYWLLSVANRSVTIHDCFQLPTGLSKYMIAFSSQQGSHNT
jgi:hypothetical protein